MFIGILMVSVFFFLAVLNVFFQLQILAVPNGQTKTKYKNLFTRSTFISLSWNKHKALLLDYVSVGDDFISFYLLSETSPAPEQVRCYRGDIPWYVMDQGRRKKKPVNAEYDLDKRKSCFAVPSPGIKSELVQWWIMYI